MEKPRHRCPAKERHTSRKPCPNYRAAKNGNCFRQSLNWSSLAMCVCDMDIAVADFPETIQTPQATRMIGTSASVNVTAYASDCAVRYLMTGSLDSGW